MEHERELEEQLLSIGNRLLNPPSCEDELLQLLDDAEALLSRVEQWPSQSVSSALLLARNALVDKELLRHSNMDVKVAVASCISEIIRITAPDAPYDDELMKTRMALWKEKVSEDPGWQHGTPVAEDRQKIKCNYCGKVIGGGGVTRLKWHLAGGNLNVVMCPSCPKDVQQAMSRLLKANKWVAAEKEKQKAEFAESVSEQPYSYRPPKKGKRKSDSAPRETKMNKHAKSSALGNSKGDGTLDGGKHSGDAPKSPSDCDCRVSKFGIKLDDTTPTPGSKSEKRGSKSKDDTSKISSKPKEDTASNSKDDAKKTLMEMKTRKTPRSDGDEGEAAENCRRDIVEVTEEQRAHLAKVVKGRVVLDPVKLEESRIRWRKALVGKFLGKMIPIEVLRKIIKRRWNCSTKVSAIDLMQSGYYCFKFECSQDMLDIWEGSPWTFNDKILVLKPWYENFRPERDVIDKALVWIRLPFLPLECWQEEFLLSIASGAGRPIRVDMNSLSVEGGRRFARVCVEVNLTESLVQGIHVGAEDDPNQFFQNFVYENLPKMCYNCGKIGHLAGYCSSQNCEDEVLNREGSPGPPGFSNALTTNKGTQNGDFVEKGLVGD